MPICPVLSKIQAIHKWESSYPIPGFKNLIFRGLSLKFRDPGIQQYDKKWKALQHYAFYCCLTFFIILYFISITKMFVVLQKIVI